MFPIVRVPHSLAVDTQELLFDRADQGVQPLDKASLKRIQRQPLQHAPDAVFRRDAVPQFQRLLQPDLSTIRSRIAPRQPVCSRQHNTHRNDHRIHQPVLTIDRGAKARQF